MALIYGCGTWGAENEFIDDRPLFHWAASSPLLPANPFQAQRSCAADADRANRPSKIAGGPVVPARARTAAVRPLRAAQPECRNFDSVPSTQHSSSPAAKLPTIPTAREVVSTSSPISTLAR